MKINVQVKKIRKKIQNVESQSYELLQCPQSLRELICIMVRDSVREYNQRMHRSNPTEALSADEMEDMIQVGKVAFGISYGNQEASVEDAIETAVMGFADGLYRFFINDAEITELDAPLDICENDTVTIIRLVMLTGGFF